MERRLFGCRGCFRRAPRAEPALGAPRPAFFFKVGARPLEIGRFGLDLNAIALGRDADWANVVCCRAYIEAMGPLRGLATL